MKRFDIIFLCLVRDCEKSLNIFFHFLDSFPKKKKVKVVFGENNSKDNTRKKIAHYKSKSLIDIELLNIKKLNKISDRITRITHGRYFLQKYILKKNYKSKIVCIADVDNVLKNKKNLTFNFFNKLIESLKKNRHILNGISVKTSPFYYDILASQSKKIKLPNILEIQKSKNIFKGYYLRKKFIFSNQKKINKIKKNFTLSSFNGMCLYNYDDYIKGDYFYKEKKSNKIVKFNEHLKFNLSLHDKNEKYILIDDNFYLSTPDEHYPYDNFIDFFLSKLKNFFNFI